MLGLINRYTPKNLIQYFKADLKHPLWDCLDERHGKQLSPAYAITKNKPASTGLPSYPLWMPLNETRLSEFMLDFEKRAKRSKRRVTRSLLSYELVFAAPKSFSIAALAGQNPDNQLLTIHRTAVDTALAAINEYLVTRKTNGSVRSYPSAHPTLLRFTHCSNKNDEPHLHDHIVILNPVNEGAIDGYALYCHQKSLRVIYHSVLTSSLLLAGIDIDFNKDAPMIWNIKKVPKIAYGPFSTRTKDVLLAIKAYEGKPYYLAKLIASLETRRKLGKEDPLISLSVLRAKWMKIWEDKIKAPPLTLMPFLPKTYPSNFSDIPQPAVIFAPSSIMTRLMIMSRFLSLAIQDGVPFESARVFVDEWIAAKVKEGEIVEGRRGFFCHLETFEAESSILAALTLGVRQKNDIDLEGVALPDIYKPAKITLRSGLVDKKAPIRDAIDICSNVTYHAFKEWKPMEVASIIKRQPHDKNLDLFVEGRFLEGEFIFQAKKIRSPNLIPELTKSRWRNGRVKIDTKEFLLAKTPVEAYDIASPNETLAILAKEPNAVANSLERLQECSENSRHTISGFRSMEWGDLNRIVTVFAQCKNSNSIKDVGVLAKKRFGLFDHGKFYEILNHDLNGWHLKGKRKPVSDQDFENSKRHLMLVGRDKYKIRPGSRLQILVGQRIKKRRLHGKEQVVVEQVLEDGSLKIVGGRVIPASFTNLSAHVSRSRELIQKVDVAILGGVTPDEVDLDKMLKLNCRRIVLLPSDSNFEDVRNVLAEQHASLFRRKAFEKFLRIKGNQFMEVENFLGSRRQWKEGIEMSKLKNKSTFKRLQNDGNVQGYSDII